MKYHVKIKSKAEKVLEKLTKSHRGRILVTLCGLQNDPFQGKRLEGKNEKDLKRLSKGQSIQESRDEIYANALRIKLKNVAKTHGDEEILARLAGEANE